MITPGFRCVVPLMAGLLLGAAAPPAAPDRLTARDRHDLRCAAAFAIVAVAQANGDTAVPTPLGIRGKRYFGLIGERVSADAGLSGQALRDILAQTAQTVARDGATATAQSCLGDLDTVVPPRPAPDALTCFALLDVYAQVLASRDAQSPLGQTLRRLSARLDAPAHAVLRARGIDAPAQPAAIAREQARVRDALQGGSGGIDADDFNQCRNLATANTG